jgi:dipeptidase E
MKFLLTSAGLTSDKIADALVELAGKSFSEMKILFVTTAANTSVEDKTWLTENIFEFTSREPLSFDLLDIAGLPKELWQKHFVAADVICVGGGDEAYLSRIFAEQGVKEFLNNSMKDRVYVGISAGSTVVGVFMPKGLNIELYGEECEADDGTGMEFYDFVFLPHLNSPYFPNVTTESIEKNIDRFTSRVIAVDDFTAINLDGDKIEFIGDGVRQEY